MSYDDAYTLQLISPSLTDKISYVSGQIPFLQRFLKHVRNKMAGLIDMNAIFKFQVEKGQPFSVNNKQPTMKVTFN